jgi:tetratricopeptide (TPR) repeat protein
MTALSSAGEEKQADTAAKTDAERRSVASQATDTAAAMARAPRLGAAVGRLLGQRRVWVVLLLLVLVVAALWTYPRLRFWDQIWAWYHFRAAQSALERYHNPQAIRHLLACRRVWSEDADVILLSARAARRAGSYAEAQVLLDQYQKARGLDDAASFEQLLLSAERGVDLFADLCWRYVEQDHPGTPLLLEALTRGYLRQYRLIEARACLNRWFQSEPNNPQALCLDGQFHLDYAQARGAAETSFRRAVEIDPEHEDARLGLAVALLYAKDYSEAAEHLEYLRKRQPENYKVQVELAECWNSQDRVNEATQLVEAVLAKQPQFPPALSLRGRLAFKEEQYAEAETWLRQSVAGNPSDHLARYTLVQCLRQNGKQEEAEEKWQQVLQMEEDLKRFNEIVTRDMLQRPRDPALHCTLGQLLLRGGHLEEGLRWLQSALRLDPGYAPAREALNEYQKQAQSKTSSRDQ